MGFGGFFYHSGASGISERFEEIGPMPPLAWHSMPA